MCRILNVWLCATQRYKVTLNPDNWLYLFANTNATNNTSYVYIYTDFRQDKADSKYRNTKGARNFPGIPYTG